MRIKKYSVSIFITLFFSFGIAISGGYPVPSSIHSNQSGKSAIVCTTTHLSSIVDAVGAGRFETNTIIPFGMCPGHFDLSPGEARNLLEAPLLLYHGYEQFLTSVDFGNRTNNFRIGVQGNWMIPDVQKNAVWEIATVLSGLQPAHSDEFTARAENYVAAITAAKDSLCNCFSLYRGMPVVCAVMNRDFVEWMGLRVIVDYPSDEDISIKTMRKIIIERGKQGVKLVIDNMQSRGKVGRTIAENLNVPLAVLTNYPDTASPKDSGYPYIRALIDNYASVIEALEQSNQYSGDTTQ